MLAIPKGDRKELQNFSVIIACALGILGGIGLWRKGEPGGWLWAAGLLILLAGFLRPKLLALPYRFWMALGLVLGFITTHVILAVMYYFAFTPVGIMMRIFSRDPMARGFNRKAQSYWVKREEADYGQERYEKMY